jgi:hypothetical protein
MGGIMARYFCAAFVFALAAVAPPAHAAIIEWDLTNVAEVSNPSVTFTGFFDYDTSSNPSSGMHVNNGSITMFNSGSPVFTWTSADQFDEFYGKDIVAGSGGPGFDSGIALGVSTPFDGSVTTLPLITGGGYSFFQFTDITSSTQTTFDLSGSLTEASISAVPLPPTAPMFAVAVLALGAFARRRHAAR